MSVIPDAREVLIHLNYLGYTNITAHQLKEFMIDLKRFVKYDQQLHPKYKEQAVQYEEDKENDNPIPENNRNIFESLHQTDTVASKAKKKSKTPKKQHKTKQHVITVEINKPRFVSSSIPNIVPKIVIPQDSDDDLPLEFDKTKHTKVNNNTSKETFCCNCQCGQNTKEFASVNDEKVDAGDNIDTKSGPSTSKSLPSLPLTGTTGTTNYDGAKKSSRVKSSRSSYIRPKVLPKPIKSDPVALYHQYKQEWDKIKFPGEAQHGETRWAIREKLLGDRY